MITENIVNIFIIEAFEDRINGYKTFKECLIEGLLSVDQFSISIITEEAPINCVTRSKCGNISHISFPKIEKDKFLNLELLFSKEIPKMNNMIFISNYYPAVFNAEAIKKVFPDSKLIHVIHDLPWLSKLNGNVCRYIDWLQGKTASLSANDEEFLLYTSLDIMKTGREADISVCLCENTFNMMADIYEIPEEKLYLINNGLKDKYIHMDLITKSKFRAKYGIPQDKQLILCIGRLSVAKGTDRLKGMLKKIIPAVGNACLAYIGEDNIFNWIDNETLIQIIPLGVKNREEIFELYSIADFGIISSRYEQCSYVGIEMLMSGLPVFTNEAPGLSDMFTHDNSLILTIGDKIINIDNLALIKYSARKTYLSKYSQEIMTKKWIDLIKHLSTSNSQ